jgi:tetratricopeptide (TPR) repeat protein
MKTLEDLLELKKRVVIDQTVSSIGGVGKTRLAVEYAHKHQSGYPGGVLWIGDSNEILIEYGLLSEVLGLELPMDMKEDEKCRMVKNYLQHRRERTLLILDNLNNKENLESIRSYLPNQDNCRIIVTTRLKDLNLGEELSLDILMNDKALELFLAESGRKDKNIQPARRICVALGNLPMSITVAGRFLKDMSSVPLNKYYKELTEDRTVVLGVLREDTEVLRESKHDVGLKYVLCIHRKLKKNPRVVKMLTALVCFEPYSVNPEILAMVCGMNWEKEKKKIWKKIKGLDKYSILQIREDNRLSIHRLMRESLKEPLSLGNIKAMETEYVSQLQKWFRINNNPTSSKTVTLELPHILWVTSRAMAESTWPQSYDLCLDLGRYYYFMGRYQESLDWCEKSRNLAEMFAPEDYEMLRQSYNAAGVAHSKLGEYEEAIDCYEKSVDYTKKLFGDRHASLSSIFNNLGKTWDNLKDYNKSMSYYKQALSIEREHGGERHPNVAVQLSNLGNARHSLEEYAKAIDHYERALSIDKEYYGKRHPRIAEDLNNLGRSWDSLKEYETAIDNYKQALLIDKKHYGKRHPKVAEDLNNLGGAWDCLEEHRKAKTLYKRALSIWKKVYGQRHPQVAAGLNNLGETWKALGKYKKAIGLYEEALSIDEEYYGKRHPDVAIDLNNLGETCQSMGERDKARAYYKRAHDIFCEFLGDDHPHTKKVKENIKALPAG